MDPKRRSWLAVGLVVATTAFTSCDDDKAASHAAGYPLARQILGGASSALAKASPEELARTMQDDLARIERARAGMHRTLGYARSLAALRSTRDLANAPYDVREQVRSFWWSSLEHLQELSAVRARYRDWAHIDFHRHPALHAKAFVLNYAAVASCAEHGYAIMQLVGDRSDVQALLNEARPQEGIPRGTFQQLRRGLAGVHESAVVLVGKRWFDRWLRKPLQGAADYESLLDLTYDKAKVSETPKGARLTVLNELQSLKKSLEQSAFPTQKSLAAMAGDIRFVDKQRALVGEAQLKHLQARLQPGDILLERRNWYLSNVGLPGFWPHAAIHVGDPAQIREFFEKDRETSERYGNFADYLAKNYAQAWRALGQPDEHGKARRVIEAVGEGVVANSLEHSCSADYVAAMRPRLRKVEIAQAIEQAFSYFGRPYDFDFDFTTDDRVVCSELVLKSYKSGDRATKGIRFRMESMLGKPVLSPTAIAKLFADEHASGEPQLEFVAFVEGIEHEKQARVRDEAAFIESANRPKWDVLQE